MKSKIILLLFLAIAQNTVFGQNKKELRASVLQLQADSTSLQQKIQENDITISRLNTEISESKILTAQLNNRIEVLAKEQQANTILKDSIKKLNTSLASMSMQLDSIKSYYKVIDFVKAFYSSLELNDEELLQQYEFGDFKFNMDNFNSLVCKDARYSVGRVKNLSDQKNNDKYFIMLIDIEEIIIDVNKIVVKTQAMYSGEKMGLFYNEEQLTLVEYKGLLKLTDWVDIDLYKIAPTLEWNDVTFTKADFYKWIDGSSR